MLFFISFLSGTVLFFLFQYVPFSAIGAFLLSSAYLAIKKKYFYILIILSGIAFAFIRYEPMGDMSSIRGKDVVVRGIFESHPIKTESGMFRQALKVKSAVDKKSGEGLNELHGREVMLFSDSEFDFGTEYVITIKFFKDKTRLNPGIISSENLQAYVLDVRESGRRGISLNATIQECRYRLDRYISEHLRSDSGALVAAITTGQRVHISEDLRDAFNSTGLAHILSISGTHFGLFSVFLFGIFRSLIKAFPYRVLQRITIFLTPSQAAAILCFPFMLSYLCLSGGSVPAVRSFVMIGLFLLGLIIGRKGFWLNSLIFAAFVLAVWKPDVVFDLSFQLSFLAVLFIGFSIGYMEGEKREDKKVLRYFRNAALLTLSASIGTAPLVAYYFHYFSIISPLSNLLVAPLIGFILIPLSVISSFLFLITGHYISTPVVSAVSDISIVLVKLLADIPFADVKIPAFPIIIVLLFYAGFLFYLLSGKKRYVLIMPFVPFIIYFTLSILEKRELTVTCLDVGQGDSSVVELSDGKTIVIDTGKTGKETASFLKYRGKQSVDAIILSHPHPDHTGGLEYLIKRFKVGEIWDNGMLIYPENYDQQIKHRTFKRGDIIEGRGYKMYFFHPYPGFYTMHGDEYLWANNDSLVLKIEGRYKSFLFTGDIDEEAEEDIAYLGRWLKSDVLKVPHHGGKTSAYKPFFETVAPESAIISVGRDNRFGHPHREILNILQGIKIFRTDVDGAIKMRESENGLETKTYRDFRFERAHSFNEEIKNVKRIFRVW